jgi:hypothetical protein
MKQRIAIALVVVALAPFLIAGGENPPPPSTVKISGPMVNAVVVIDPHNNSESPDNASLWLQRGGNTAGAVFLSAKKFNLGCDPTLTSERFVFSSSNNNRLRTWVPSGGDFQGDVLTALFSQLGVSISSANDPVITDVTNVVCTANPGAFPGSPLPGFLSFQAAVQFAH